jgi:hypothetical protein
MGRGDALALLPIWSLIVGVACVAVGVGAFWQVVSGYWPRADGIVTVSERNRGPKRSKLWDLQYKYTVAGRQYTGTQYAYDPMPIQAETDLLSHMQAYPVGAAVVLSYKPSNPAEAVIRPGLRGETLIVALFLNPFILVGVAVGVGLVRQSWSRPDFDPTDARQVTLTSSGAIVVRPQRPLWPVIFLTYVGMTAFLVSWAVLFIGGVLDMVFGMFKGHLIHPPLLVAASVWAAVLVGCALATWRVVKNTPRFIVDPVHEVFQFSRRRLPACEIPLAAIADISITERTDRQRNGKAVRHRVKLTRGDGGAAIALADYDDLRDAEALADWLRQQLCDQPGAGKWAKT